ncbi:hypothetical protein DFH05DRAFT_1146678 [Lentinula detonsa]|uniref:Transmembrane protein n=1 Tax=Lentinula detonsa TaxID=2804962 RepID=A0A9W8P067_9AGAR|nr:hypothetical protein DFH05DRAFT_1146678 [Lentinula detonsa]
MIGEGGGGKVCALAACAYEVFVGLVLFQVSCASVAIPSTFLPIVFVFRVSSSSRFSISAVLLPSVLSFQDHSCRILAARAILSSVSFNDVLDLPDSFAVAASCSSLAGRATLQSSPRDMSFHATALSMRIWNSSVSFSVCVGLGGLVLGFGFVFVWNAIFVCVSVPSFPGFTVFRDVMCSVFSLTSGVSFGCFVV